MMRVLVSRSWGVGSAMPLRTSSRKAFFDDPTYAKFSEKTTNQVAAARTSG